MAIGYARKLAVIALSIRPAGGAQPTTAITQQGLRWLWDSAGGTGIPAFWRESTAGLVRLDTEVFGYLAIEDSDLHAAMTAGKRSAQVQLALDAATAQGVALPDHDGVVLVIAGIATIDGGKTVGSLGGRMLPVALFDQQGQHDFLAHEVGHVIGLEHPFRQSFTRYVNGEYGDPTCIMSAMTYGDLAPAPTRALTPVPGCGVAATSNLWSAAGPGPSPATLWRHCGEYPAAPPWVQLLPVDPKPTPVTLCAPSSTRAGTRLAVIPTGAMAPAPGYYTVEYRPAIGWDSVLSRQAGIGDTAGCAGLVVHRIVDIGTSAQYGFPRTQAVEYVDTIPIPVGGRVTWNNSTFVVRVAENAVTADGAIAVELAEYTPASVWARLTLEVVETAVTRTPDQVVTVPMMGPSCTPHSVHHRDRRHLAHPARHRPRPRADGSVLHLRGERDRACRGDERLLARPLGNAASPGHRRRPHRLSAERAAGAVARGALHRHRCRGRCRRHPRHRVGARAAHRPWPDHLRGDDHRGGRRVVRRVR